MLARGEGAGGRGDPRLIQDQVAMQIFRRNFIRVHLMPPLCFSSEDDAMPCNTIWMLRSHPHVNPARPGNVPIQLTPNFVVKRTRQPISSTSVDEPLAQTLFVTAGTAFLFRRFIFFSSILRCKMIPGCCDDMERVSKMCECSQSQVVETTT